MGLGALGSTVAPSTHLHGVHLVHSVPGKGNMKISFAIQQAQGLRGSSTYNHYKLGILTEEDSVQLTFSLR